MPNPQLALRIQERTAAAEAWEPIWEDSRVARRTRRQVDRVGVEADVAKRAATRAAQREALTAAQKAAAAERASLVEARRTARAATRTEEAAAHREDVLRRLREHVTSGVYSAGDKLEPRAKYARRLHVTERTLNPAYDALLREGVIERRPGLGYFLTTRAVPDLTGRPWFLRCSPEEWLTGSTDTDDPDPWNRSHAWARRWLTLDGLAEGTIVSYRLVWLAFAGWMSVYGPAPLHAQPSHIANWQTSLIETGHPLQPQRRPLTRKAATSMRYALSSWFNYCTAHDCPDVTDNPTARTSTDADVRADMARAARDALNNRVLTARQRRILTLRVEHPDAPLDALAGEAGVSPRTYRLMFERAAQYRAVRGIR